MIERLKCCRRYILDVAMISGMVLSVLVLAVTFYATYCIAH